jgi:hypothetical protein
MQRAEEQSQRSTSQASFIYIAGTLRLSLGQTESATTQLREALLLPDSRMTHHLVRLALAESTHP